MTVMERAMMVMATSTNAELLAMSGLRSPYPAKVGVVEAAAAEAVLAVAAAAVVVSAAAEAVSVAVALRGIGKWSTTIA